jgi:Flp pilus assembly protein TadD
MEVGGVAGADRAPAVIRSRWPLALAAGALLVGCGHLVVLNDPLTAAEHSDLGVSYERSGRADLAEREYKKAIHRDSRLAVAHLNLGNLHAARGDWSGAERCYRDALRARPDDPDALNNLATALMRRGRRLDEAETLATRAVAIGGRDSLYRATLDEVRDTRARHGRETAGAATGGAP